MPAEVIPLDRWYGRHATRQRWVVLAIPSKTFPNHHWVYFSTNRRPVRTNSWMSAHGCHSQPPSLLFVLDDFTTLFTISPLSTHHPFRYSTLPTVYLLSSPFFVYNGTCPRTNSINHCSQPTLLSLAQIPHYPIRNIRCYISPWSHRSRYMVLPQAMQWT